MKNLFLTGPIGCGKSTSIAAALGDALPKAGGFLTVRQKDADGRAIAYWLRRPDGRDSRRILDYSAKPYKMHLEVFETLGVRLLEESAGTAYIVLDEIGGFEVLSDAFLDALMAVLKSDIPCIGVMKGSVPASNMIKKLGLGDVYVERAEALRQWMRQDQDTVLYECGQYDPEGLRLARLWAEQFVR